MYTRQPSDATYIDLSYLGLKYIFFLHEFKLTEFFTSLGEVIC